MIGDTLWYLGETSDYTSASNGLTSHFYTYEREKTVYSGRDTSWIGKVGLMYPSDYGYATSGSSTTNRNACLNKELYNWDSSSIVIVKIMIGYIIQASINGQSCPTRLILRPSLT